MVPTQIRRLAGLALLTAPLLVGCASSLNAYRPQADLVRTPYATIENFGTAAIDPEQVDALLLEVADLLKVTLSPAKPKVRIIVTSPDRIATLYGSAAGTLAGHSSQAEAAYFPGASLILIPAFDRVVLGHELAHYLTEHYLTVARSQWEPIAYEIERKLGYAKRAAAAR